MSRATPPADTPAASAAHVLSYTDQALFLALRGAGQDAVMQTVWIYPHAVDLDGVRRFHRNLGRGLLARRIEPSPVPFGRHRWVAAPPVTEADLEVAERPRARAELPDWADEQLELPLDPEHGPAWRMSVQPFDDGTTAVSLVVSHCIADGGALVISVFEAVAGSHRELGYPSPGSCTRRRAAIADLRQTVRDLPEAGRTLRKVVKIARNRRGEVARPTPPKPSVGAADDVAPMTTVMVYVDLDKWDARFKELGGNSFSMVTAFAGKLAEHLGRTRDSDGMVTLLIPVNERKDFADTGGNVVAVANVSFHPAGVTDDLTALRGVIRDRLKTAKEVPDDTVELLPLIPFVPRRAFGRIADAAFGFSTDLPVSCTNMGDLPPELLRADGTAAEYLWVRGIDRHVSRADLERRGGVLTVGSCRLGGRIVLSVVSHQPGQDNSRAHLSEVVLQTLEEFGLRGEIV